MKTDRIPNFLDTLAVCPNVTAAAKSCGLSHGVVYHWLVRSRAGDAALQGISWMGVVAAFHIHWDNATKLAASAIEKAAVDRALRGTMVPVFKDGKRVWEEDERLSIYSDKQIADAYALGALDWPDRFKRDENGDRVQVTMWLKPTDQLVIKMLESHQPRRYGARQTIDVQHGHTLQLTRPEERANKPPIIDAQSQEVFDDESEQQSNSIVPKQIAAGRPAKDSAEFDKWISNGEFGHSPVMVEQADGTMKPIQAQPDPLKVGDERTDLKELRQAAENRMAMNPNAPPLEPRRGPHRSPESVAEGIGAGTVREGGYQVAGATLDRYQRASGLIFDGKGVRPATARDVKGTVTR